MIASAKTVCCPICNKPFSIIPSALFPCLANAQSTTDNTLKHNRDASSVKQRSLISTIMTDKGTVNVRQYHKMAILLGMMRQQLHSLSYSKDESAQNDNNRINKSNASNSKQQNLSGETSMSSNDDTRPCDNRQHSYSFGSEVPRTCLRILQSKKEHDVCDSSSEEEEELPGTSLELSQSKQFTPDCSEQQSSEDDSGTQSNNTEALDYNKDDMQESEVPGTCLEVIELKRRAMQRIHQSDKGSSSDEEEVPATSIPLFPTTNASLRRDEQGCGHKNSDLVNPDSPESREFPETEVPGTSLTIMPIERRELEIEQNAKDDSASENENDEVILETCPEVVERASVRKSDPEEEEEVPATCLSLFRSKESTARGLEAPVCDNNGTDGCAGQHCEALQGEEEKNGGELATGEHTQCLDNDQKKHRITTSPKNDVDEHVNTEIQPGNIDSQPEMSQLTSDVGTQHGFKSIMSPQCNTKPADKGVETSSKRRRVSPSRKSSAEVDNNSTANQSTDQLYIAYDVLNDAEARALETLNEQGLCQVVNGIYRVPSASDATSYVPFPSILVTHANEENNSTCHRSYTFLKAVALGVRIIDASWIVDSQNANNWLELESYEITNHCHDIRSSMLLKGCSLEVLRCKDLELKADESPPEHSQLNVKSQPLTTIQIASLVECLGGKASSDAALTEANVLLVPDHMLLTEIVRDLQQWLKTNDQVRSFSIEVCKEQELEDMIAGGRLNESTPGSMEGSRLKIVQTKWLEDSICNGVLANLDAYCCSVLCFRQS
jgi:hypothetical protein